MTRLIAGTHRGRPLRVPSGPGTRPTSDRAREGMFSSLQSLVELEGCRFLDLYAGSGALGLEALSRGAATATLVESGERALAEIRRNVELLGLPAEVVAADVPRWLSASTGRSYDVVALDPPYDTGVDDVLASLVAWTAPGGVVVVERRTRGRAPTWPDGVVPVRSRRYGEATLWYGSRS